MDNIIQDFEKTGEELDKIWCLEYQKFLSEEEYIELKKSEFDLENSELNHLLDSLLEFAKEVDPVQEDLQNPEKKSKDNTGSEWPIFDLKNYAPFGGINAKSGKKVPLIDQFKNHATLEAVRATVALERHEKKAHFSNIDNNTITTPKDITNEYKDDITSFIKKIPSLIKIDPIHYRGSRINPDLYTKPAQYKHSDEKLKAIFYNLALLTESKQDGLELFAFTLNLTPQFVKLAQNSKNGFIDCIKRRLDKSFKSILQRDVQYWFEVEYVDVFGDGKTTHLKGQKRPHLHGAILLHPHENESNNKQRRPISDAFHKAIEVAGKVDPEFSKILLHTASVKRYSEERQISELEAVINWSLYCVKHNCLSKMLINSKSNICVDNKTRNLGKDLFNLMHG